VYAHDRASVRSRDDETLGLEHEERLAHRSPADPELSGELLLLQAPPWLEPTVDDRLPDQLRRGDARVPDESAAVLEDPRHGAQHTVCTPSGQCPSRRVGGPPVRANTWAIFSLVDRKAIGRSARRKQALDALEFERERASSLEEQIEAIVADLEGPGIDEETFARMAPEDVEEVRAALLQTNDQALDVEWLELVEEDADDDSSGKPRDGEEPEEDVAEELDRLHEEIAASRRRQVALERYLEALNG
jgi:hypothetical protein